MANDQKIAAQNSDNGAIKFIEKKESLKQLSNKTSENMDNNNAKQRVNILQYINTSSDNYFNMVPIMPKQIMFNRIPKCASTCLKFLFKHLCKTETKCDLVSSKIFDMETPHRKDQVSEFQVNCLL